MRMHPNSPPAFTTSIHPPLFVLCLVETKVTSAFSTPSPASTRKGKRRRSGRNSLPVPLTKGESESDENPLSPSSDVREGWLQKKFKSSWKGHLKTLFHFKKFPDQATILQFIVQSIRDDLELDETDTRSLTKLVRYHSKSMHVFFGKGRSQRANTIRCSFVQQFDLGSAPPQLKVAISAEFREKIEALGKSWWQDMPKVLRVMHKAYGGPLPVLVDKEEHTYFGDVVSTFKNFTYSDFHFYRATLLAYFEGGGITQAEHFYNDIGTIDDVTWPPEEWAAYVIKEKERSRKSVESVKTEEGTYLNST